MGVFSENAIIGASAAGGYDIDQSLRFGDGYLKKSFSSGTNPDKLTISCWVKPANFGNAARTLFYGYTDANNYEKVVWNANGNIYWSRRVSGSVSFEAYSSMVFRDAASWYHLVLVYDSTDVTTSSRIKFYVNGVLQTKSVDSPTPPTNLDSLLLSASCSIGDDELDAGTYGRFESYMAECHAIDGQALTPASFGETNSATNQWIPVEYSGSYGTNGFYQKYSATELAASFEDSAWHQTHTVTAGGDAHTDTSVKKFGTASAQFDGTGDYLTVPDSSEFSLFANTTDSQTLDFWVNHSVVSSGQVYFMPREAGTDYWFIRHDSPNILLYGKIGDSVFINQSASAFSDTGAWHHIALVKVANKLGVYVDGTQIIYTTFSTTKDFAAPLIIGSQDGGSDFFNGYMDEVRWSNSNVFNADPNSTPDDTITVPAAAYECNQYTKLLLHMDGVNDGTTFTDSSNCAPRHTITANGDVTNTRAQAKIGDSSIKFDGTGDYLTVPDSSDWAFGTDNFTVEFWLNHQSVATGNSAITFSPSTDKRQLFGYVDAGDGLFKLYLTSDGSNWDIASGVSMGTATLDSWKHYAIVRSGTSFYTFQDGTQISTFTSSASMYDSSDALSIGRYAGGNELNGYMDEIRISNSARYTSAFTPSTTAFTADANTMLLIHSEWNGGLGADSSGNKNDFSPTNLVATDQVLDSPTNNFATLNPIYEDSSAPPANVAFAEGNLSVTGTSGNFGVAYSTMTIPASGKWYLEAYLDYGEVCGVGIVTASGRESVNNGWGMGAVTTAQGFTTQLSYVRNSQSNTLTLGTGTPSNGDIYQLAIDADNNKVWIGLDNSWNDASGGTTGNPSSGSNHTIALTFGSDAQIGFQRTNSSPNTGMVANFGQDSSFAGNKTAQGNGGDGEDFYYTPPTGYKALNTDNLDNPAIALPTDHFETVLWTGDGADTKAIAASDFVMDFAWIKSRDETQNNVLYDRVRGTGMRLVSNSNQAEADLTSYGNQVEFTAPGINVGSTNAGYEEEVNKSSVNYVGWNWKAGGTGSSNGDGSITSSVSANTDAGFSIGTYTGNGTAGATVGHGLSQAPELIIVKCYDGLTFNWTVGWGAGGAAWTDYMHLDTSAASVDDLDFWRDTYPTSSVFTIGSNGNVNYNNDDFVFYAFHSVEGYSKVGSYTGNANADGPFIYTGFRPAFFLWKNTTGYSWGMTDNKRAGYNPKDYQLYANASDAEATSYHMVDFLSNGVKITSTDGTSNGSGNEIIFMAFAESPFKTSNAR